MFNFTFLFILYLICYSSFAHPIQPRALDSSNNTDSIITIMLMHDPGTAILWLTAALGVACAVILCVRYWIRHKKHLLGLDDHLMLLGLFCYIFDSILAGQAVREGIGRPKYVIDFTRPLLAVKWVVYWSFGFAISTVPIRVSMALSILRLSRGSRYRLLVAALIFMTIGAAAMQTVWVAMACVPLSYLWDSVDQVGHCAPIDQTVTSIWMFAILSIIIDLGIAFIPAFFLWNLQLTKTRKLQAWLFCGAGLSATGATVGRMLFLGAYRDLGFWSTDFYMTFAGVILCSQFELALAIISSSLGSVNQLRDHFARKKLFKGLVAEPRKGKPTKFFGTTTEITGGRPQETVLQKVRNLVTTGQLERPDVRFAGSDHAILVQTTVEVTTEADFEGAYGYADGRSVTAPVDSDLNHLFVGGPSSRLSYELQRLPAIDYDLDTPSVSTISVPSEESSITSRRRRRRNPNARRSRTAKK